MPLPSPEVPLPFRVSESRREALAADPRPLSGSTWAVGGTFRIVPSGDAWRVVVLDRGVRVQRFGPFDFAQAVNVGSALGPVSSMAPTDPGSASFEA